MLDNSIVNKTSQEANWNGQTDRWTDGQDHVLSQADALTKNIKEHIHNLVYCHLNCSGLDNVLTIKG